MSRRLKSFLIVFFTIFAVWLFMLFMSGCSVPKRINYHNKQSARHYDKAIRLGYKPSADTVYIQDTVLLTETRLDTTFIEKQGDTILIEKDRLKIKYIRIADSVFIEGTCEADTIIKRIPYTVQEKIYIDKTFFDYIGLDTWWKQSLFWIGLILLVAIILWRLIKP